MLKSKCNVWQAEHSDLCENVQPPAWFCYISSQELIGSLSKKLEVKWSSLVPRLLVGAAYREPAWVRAKNEVEVDALVHACVYQCVHGVNSLHNYWLWSTRWLPAAETCLKMMNACVVLTVHPLHFCLRISAFIKGDRRGPYSTTGLRCLVSVFDSRAAPCFSAMFGKKSHRFYCVFVFYLRWLTVKE